MAKGCSECPQFRCEQEDRLDGDGDWYTTCAHGRDTNRLTGNIDHRFPYKRPWCFGGLKISLTTTPEGGGR